MPLNKSCEDCANGCNGCKGSRGLMASKALGGCKDGIGFGLSSLSIEKSTFD